MGREGGERRRVGFDVINHHNLLQFPKTNMTGWNYFAMLRQSFAEAIKCQNKSKDEIYLIWGNSDEDPLLLDCVYKELSSADGVMMQVAASVFILPNQTGAWISTVSASGSCSQPGICSVTSKRYRFSFHSSSSSKGWWSETQVVSKCSLPKGHLFSHFVCWFYFCISLSPQKRPQNAP